MAALFRHPTTLRDQELFLFCVDLDNFKPHCSSVCACHLVITSCERPLRPKPHGLVANGVFACFVHVSTPLFFCFRSVLFARSARCQMLGLCFPLLYYKLSVNSLCQRERISCAFSPQVADKQVSRLFTCKGSKSDICKAHKLLPQVASKDEIRAALHSIASKDEIRAALHSIVSALPLGWSPAVRKSLGFKGHLSTAPSRTSRAGLASLLLFLFHSSRISRAVFRVPMRASSATGVVRIQLRLHRVA